MSGLPPKRPMPEFSAVLQHPHIVRLMRLIQGLSRRPRAMAALSGLFAALAQPPFGLLPGLLGYGLLLYALERDLGAKPKRTAFFMGWLAGFCYFLVSCFWVAEAFLVDAKTYGWMAPFAATLLPSGIALFWGAFAVLYTWLRPRNWSRFLFFASLFSLFEITRGTVLSGFPWNPAGSSWKAGSAMSQMAAYVGVYGLGFVTVLAFSAVGIVRRGRGVAGYAPAIFGALVLIGCFTVGETRLLTTKISDTGYAIRFVQPAFSQEAKWTRSNFADLFETYVRMSKARPLPGHRAPDLIIWPEGALPVMWETLTDPDNWMLPSMTSLLADKQSLMIGTSRQELDTTGHLVYRNSMLVLRSEDGQTRVTGAYNKFKLVPFGEFTPYQDIANKIGISALTHFDESFTPGERTKPQSFPAIPRVLPLICYEGIFPSLDMTRYKTQDTMRPKWIVNISNDAWFGPTTGPVQHLNLASFRALEEGLPMVRSTPTGISVVVDPLGRPVSGTDLGLGKAGYMDVTLPGAVTTTPFAQERNLIVIFISLFCLIVWLVDKAILRKKGTI
jgi:apolipoprotein N-acyltransferase